MSDLIGVSDGQVGNIESPRAPQKYTLKQIYTFCSFIGYPIEKIFLTEEDQNDKQVINKIIERIIEYDG